MPTVKARIEPARSTVRRTLLAGVAAALVYLAVAGDLRLDFRQSPHPHHLLLADALWHGRFDVRPEVMAELRARDVQQANEILDAEARRLNQTFSKTSRQQFVQAWQRGRSLLDWSIVEGRYYGYWGPFVPAVLAPLVGLLGWQISDRLVAAVAGGLNVALFYLLLRRADRAGLCRTSEACRVGLTIVFALGSVHFYSACVGSVWFSVQLITLTAILAALLLVCGPRFSPWLVLLAGVAFGAAMLGRNLIVLLGLFFPLLFWQRCAGVPAGRLRRWLACSVLFAVPCATAVVVQGAYNRARFGSVFDSGQAALMRTTSAAALVPDYERYGQFHPHYLAKNLKYYFWNWRLPRDAQGRLTYDDMGNSMFLVTPPLIYALLAWRRRSPIALAAACGVVPFLIGLLLFRTTGYQQFGNRYLLEALPLLLVLAAEGMTGRLNAPGYVLIVLAVAMNLFGTYRFCGDSFQRVAPFVGWYTLPALGAAALAAGILGRHLNRRHESLLAGGHKRLVPPRRRA